MATSPNDANSRFRRAAPSSAPRVDAPPVTALPVTAPPSRPEFASQRPASRRPASRGADGRPEDARGATSDYDQFPEGLAYAPLPQESTAVRPIGEAPPYVAPAPQGIATRSPSGPGAGPSDGGYDGYPVFAPPGDDFPVFAAPNTEWTPVDKAPGRGLGITSIVVGVFVGLVGLLFGIFAIHAARRGGGSGWLGLVGVVLSIANIVVGIVVLVSFLHYASSLTDACASVSPGQYVTDSGFHVTCH